VACEGFAHNEVLTNLGDRNVCSRMSPYSPGLALLLSGLRQFSRFIGRFSVRRGFAGADVVREMHARWMDV
jgi:hypothetical protein